VVESLTPVDRELGLTPYKHGTVRIFDRNLHSRSAIEFHTFAPLEALPCVWSMAFCSDVHFLTCWNCNLRLNTEGQQVWDRIAAGEFYCIGDQIRPYVDHDFPLDGAELVRQRVEVRCACSNRNLHSRSAIELHAFVPPEALACVDQWHSSRVFAHLTGWHCKPCRTTEGVAKA
jgi:hypothetical protein